MSAFRHMLLFNSQSKCLTAWMLESPWRPYIMKKWKQLFRCLVQLFSFSFFFLAKTSRLYPKLCLRESGLSGDFSSLLCRNCLLNSAVMRLVMQGCCRGQNTKCSMQVCNKIIFAHSLPANFKQCPLENPKMLPDTKMQKSQVNCWIFDILFMPFPIFHWDQFSHWQKVWLFLQPVAGEMRKLMFTGGMELALLLAVFVQLHLFTVCVNINLHVLLCCHHFSFQWKQQRVIVGDVFFFQTQHLFLSSYFSPHCLY